jgi:hypothetical protein
MDQSLENRIRERAYEMWTAHGCVHGHADAYRSPRIELWRRIRTFIKHGLVCSAGAVMTFDLARRADERFKATMMQMLRPSRRLPNSVEPEVTRRAAILLNAAGPRPTAAN